MKILAFAASNSSQSINKKLIQFACSQIKEADTEILDINDFEMPLYSADREKVDGIPKPARSFYKRIGGADGLLISYAEHNGTYTAAFKNLYDWASRVDAKVFQQKPMVLLATSPGPGGASSVLNQAKNSAPFFGGTVLVDLSIPNFYENFDESSGELSNTELRQKLQEAVDAFG